MQRILSGELIGQQSGRLGPFGRVAIGYADRHSRQSLGRWGEWVALRYVRRLGWDVVARNWRSRRRGEIDLIAYHGPCLIFLEVKTRLMPSQFPPEDNLSSQKVRQLERLAFEFALRYEMQKQPMRIDLIAIETSDLRRFHLRHYAL